MSSTSASATRALSPLKQQVVLVPCPSVVVLAWSQQAARPLQTVGTDFGHGVETQGEFMNENSLWRLSGLRDQLLNQELDEGRSRPCTA